jgi:F0F1-type ATP synthase assembly protein I
MAQVGFEMVVPIAVGMMLDRYLEWMPWATVGGAVLGFVGGVMHLALLSRSADAANSSQPPRDGP